MDSLCMLEVGAGSPAQSVAAGALSPQPPPPGPSQGLTVLIAGPDDSTTAALRTTLSEGGVQSVLRARSAAAVRDLLGRGVTGDLAVVTARFGADTDPLIAALRGHGWRRVLVCAPIGAARPVISAIGAGATGVLTAPGMRVLDPAVRHLTAREIQVITLVADGHSNKEIGTRMSLSALTVKNHLARIGRKLRAGDRAQIVALACRHGIIT